MSVRSCTSRPYHMMELSVSSETLGGSQNGSALSEVCHQSFHEHVSAHSVGTEDTRTSPPRPLQHSFDPWMLDGPSYGRPLSTCSSLSPSESIATPPSYTEQLPLPEYQLHEQHSGICRDSATGYASYGNVSEVPWGSQFPASNNCGAHSLMPSWSNNVYPGLPSPATEPFVPSMPIVTAPVFPLPGSSQPTTNHFAVHSEPSRLKGDGSTDDSDSESEGSDDEDHEESDGSTVRRASKSGNHVQTPCFLMSKWDLSGMNHYGRLQSHSFFCPLTGQRDMKGRICNAKFARPEHCRRHVKTVHDEVKDYRCKVPQCGRPFSRGDNLRDHYWTHLQRGGRIGRNDKMSLAELKEILGKSEKKLIRKLKQRMAKHKAKQVRAPVMARS
ncbi:hypothetical protein T440DRAFT_459881 [Plenodomus tracheiphilus IPT5]|uniref:C2H2-type domain-containing protein n=1 Tax=Plenodomus tracheiphilus IPT5 TaxID=1408161 RepID=A0A6A7ATK0_9PLEO|nr:hypothetical protein T440DRAFT_459881 [Plenodomus tracheiphilus IPT5]